MLQRKNRGDRLTLKEFEELERRLSLDIKRPPVNEFYNRTFITAKAHTALPAYSIFTLGTEISELKFNTKQGLSFVLCTNGNNAIASGDLFRPEFIASDVPVLIRVDGTVEPGMPCGINGTGLVLIDDFSSGIVAVSTTANNKAYVVRSHVPYNVLVKTTSAITEYNSTTKQLGTGTAKVMKTSSTAAVNPKTGTGDWNVVLWNTHPCPIDNDVLCSADSMMNVGLCVNHPQWIDAVC